MFRAEGRQFRATAFDPIHPELNGQTCRVDGAAMAGSCSNDAGLEEAQKAAQIAMLNCLAALSSACNGDLTRLTHIVRLCGFVRSTEDFTGHTSVLDAASRVLNTAFAALTLPARTAVGVNSLPDCAWIEIEMDVIARAT